MSMALDSPMEMEMIAINYLKNHAFFATHFWAWIAFFTAAISFSWKIKSSIIHSSSSSNHQPPILDDDDDDDEVVSTSTTPTAAAANYSSTTKFYRLENRRSGKFSLHYEQPDNNINVHKDEEYLEEEEDRGMGVVVDYDDDEEQEESMTMMMVTSTNCSSQTKHNNYYDYKDDGYLEMKMQMQTREMGWYLYQDLSILDGNVVRFWTSTTTTTHHPSTLVY